MKTPYEILDVAVEASDAEIKQSYLRQVKNNPPDHEQEKFQLIHK
ncbi:MAG: DnaJ domain-containing protein, partial [Methylococcales bacterium]|nr:DnaJ domain-containing protein [Methylococcales bacterium]